MNRQTINLSGLWRFQPDLHGQGVLCHWFASDYDTRLWREVVVPCSFDQCLPDQPFYEGLGWFVRRFEVPAKWQDRHWTLRLEGICARSQVWLNGHQVGEIPDSYMRLDLSVSDRINFGTPNTLALRVDNTRVEGDVPGTQYGWRPVGGILREVMLIACDPLHVSHVSTVAEPEGNGGRFEQTVEVLNGHDTETMAHVEVILSDFGGSEVAHFRSEPVPLAADTIERFHISGAVANVQPWSPDSPTRYKVLVRVVTGGDAVDELELCIGFRSIRAQGTKLWLNGKPIFLMGFNRHEDSPRTGMCTDLETVRHDLEKMKIIGCNFIRLCHYPHHSAELDLCDELGLLVMAEIPLYWWGSGQQPPNDRTLKAAQRQLAAMIHRDINHPSIIFWSVSNETNEAVNYVVEGNRTLLEQARQADPSRLAVHVSSSWCTHPHFEADDVMCLNSYPTQTQLAGKKSVELAQSTKFWRDALAKTHQLYCNKPILITEFGLMSLKGVFGCTLGEDLHAATLEAEFGGMDAPYVCGATIWCWADHPWPANNWGGCLTTSPYGVLTRDRQPKKPFHTASRIFKGQP